MSTTTPDRTLAPVVTSRDDVPQMFFMGAPSWLRLSAETTGGALIVLEQIAEPGDSSPWHVHHNEEEMYYVIEGSLRFICNDQQWIAGPGAWVFLPRDIPHGFEVMGDIAARFLLLAAPSGFDGFVQELWEDVPAPPDMGKVMETAERYGVEILGPLPE